MLVDLVQVITSDGLRLHGALELAEGGPSEAAVDSPLVVDAWLCLHGTASNFYSASMLGGLTPKLLAGGAAVLRVNTRGHDLMSSGPSASGRWLQGAAFEQVDESALDLTAWIAFLRQRGFARIGLLGHSLGAVKAIYALATDHSIEVSLLAAVSPPHLSYSYFCETPRGDDFRQMFATAEQYVREGRGEELLFVKFPLRYYVTAAGFIDRYGPAERYNVLRLLDRVPCPTLVTYGSLEEQSDLAFRGMPAAVVQAATPENCLQVAVIAGADHFYTGCYDVLAGRITAWLNRLERAEGRQG